ncbi:YolD-like family protein [Sporosarcina soli]|uniref:YolD-like family protein n=1 Tax=Sporosarcina soli TaxID=334736 RepID=A0ABW0TTA9_9BACL
MVLNRHMKTVGGVKDRGRIKWTAMMLPEHIKELRTWQSEDELVKYPNLSEFDLQLIQEELDVACRRKCETLIKTWKAGVIVQLQGSIKEIDLRLKCIILQDQIGAVRIPVTEIVSVQCME